MAGAANSRIAEVCREEGRALITLDLDFANIQLYPPEQFLGIVVLRLAYQDKESVLTHLQQVIRLLESEDLQRRLWVVDETHLRIRQ